MERADQSNLRVVAATGSVEEADLMCMALGAAGVKAIVLDANFSAWMPHMALGVGRGGVRVAVAARDVPAAKEILHRPADQRESLPDVDEPVYLPSEEAADLARRACLAALYTWLILPMFFLTVYYLIKAMRSARRNGVADRGALRRRFWAAVVLGIVLPVVALILFFSQFASPGDYGPFKFG